MMHSVEISDEVWREIANRGKFGENEDDVLRRVFGLPERSAGNSAGVLKQTESLQLVTVGREATKAVQSRDSRPRTSRATQRMSSFVQGRDLVVEFHSGARKSFALCDRTDKQALRELRDKAVAFARENGASYGQEMAVKKALTEAGYHLMR